MYWTNDYKKIQLTVINIASHFQYNKGSVIKIVDLRICQHNGTNNDDHVYNTCTYLLKKREKRDREQDE